MLSKFSDDREILTKACSVIELSNSEGAALLISPEWQGRVMTSTWDKDQGPSVGYLNYDWISNGENTPHINLMGGEDRFWLGPEGSKYSIFFQSGEDMNMETWQTPAAIDSEPFQVVNKSEVNADFTSLVELQNYQGTSFKVGITRGIRIFSTSEINKTLGVELPDSVETIGYVSHNVIKNLGKEDWKKETGLLSIWILGMLRFSPNSTVLVPFIQGEESSLGPIVTTDYFAPVPPNRIKVLDNIILYRVDGGLRTKIGVNSQRATNLIGSYDPNYQLLTVVKYSRNYSDKLFVNSLWDITSEPYSGDVNNSFCDGKVDGSVQGEFFELESSSAALELKVGETGTHMSETFHFHGETAELNVISQKLFGFDLTRIQTLDFWEQD